MGCIKLDEKLQKSEERIPLTQFLRGLWSLQFQDSHIYR